MCKINVEFVTEIRAKPEKIWDILADAEGWPKWQGTDFVKLETPGPLKKGSVFKANLGSMRWDLTVIEANRPRSIAWGARRPGLNAVHSWEFQERGGKIVATTRETVSGWMVTLLYFLVRRGLSKGDSKWLADLKAKAESA